MQFKPRNFADHRRPPALSLPPRSDFLHSSITPVINPKFEIASVDGAAEMTMFAHIGEGGVTAEGVNSSLQQFRNLPVVAKINSLGGDAFEGVTIFNLLRAHPQPVTVQVLGIAASAASIIAMAADRIEMARNSQMMIHEAWLLAIGNKSMMRKAADELEKLDGLMAATYAARSGQNVQKVSDLMDEESFMTAGEAIEMGFADDLLDRDADPMPQARSAGAPSASGTPHSLREFETALRTHMRLSRSAAAKAAAAAWPALGGAPDSIDIRLFIDRVNAASSDLERKLNARVS